MAFENGPFVQSASLCEKVLQEKDGVISLIRIVDTVTQAATGQDPPDSMPSFAYTFKLALMLKAGEAIGRYQLVLKLEEPAGTYQQIGSTSIHFEGGEKGFNLISDLSLGLKQEGIHWLHVYLDNDKLTSVPFRVRYQRVITG